MYYNKADQQSTSETQHIAIKTVNHKSKLIQQ